MPSKMEGDSVKVELVECSGAGAAIEEIKRIYGSDCLIVASIARGEKHYTIVAIENEESKTNLLELDRSESGKSSDILNLRIDDGAEISGVKNLDVDMQTDRDNLNFRDVLHNLTPVETKAANSHRQDTEVSNQLTKTEPAMQDGLSNSSESRDVEAIRIDTEVTETLSAAALNNDEIPLQNVIDTSGAASDRDRRFNDFKMSVSVDALELAALLQNAVNEKQHATESNDPNINHSKL